MLNTRHLGFIIASLAIVTLKTLPTLFIKDGGRDVWIASIIASAVILLYLWVLTSVIQTTGTSRLIDVYTGALGKAFGGILYVLFALTVLLSVFESAGTEANVMQEGFSIDTPVWVYIVVSTACATYIVKKGVASVAIVAVISISAISFSGMVLGLLTHAYKDAKYLSPIMEYGFTWNFLLAILKIVGALSCVAIFIPFIDSVGDKSKLRRHGMIAMLFVCQVIVFSFLGIITTFGIDRAENLVYPKLTQTQIISAFNFLEAGELFVMLQVVGGWFIRFVVCFFVLMDLIKMLGKRIPFIEYAIGAMTVGAAYYFSRDMFFMFRAEECLLYIQLANFFVVPLVLFCTYYLKQRKRLNRAGGVNGGPEAQS